MNGREDVAHVEAIDVRLDATARELTILIRLEGEDADRALVWRAPTSRSTQRRFPAHILRTRGAAS